MEELETGRGRGDEHHLPIPSSSSTSPASSSSTTLDKPKASPEASSNHHTGIPWSRRTFVYQYRPFRGMIADVRRRLPYYLSDWYCAFTFKNLPRVIAATIRMYFLNLFPAIAYVIDMNYRTGGAYGINELLLASALPCIVFSVFSVQPLTVVGVTGLINLYNYTTYDIIVNHYQVNYLQFVAWSLIWAAAMHFAGAIFNLCDFTRFITDMTSETFGIYVGVIYIQKGIELILLEFDHSQRGGWFSVMIAMLFSLLVYFVQSAGRKPFGPFWFRQGLIDYTFALVIVFITGCAHIPGSIKDAEAQFVDVTRAFYPSTDRSWMVDFWNLNAKWVFVAAPFGFLLTLLFYFDHNVSSLMAQARQYPVKRPAGFHWDFFLLGITTLVAAILGIPAPNGLVPQAPEHTEALSVIKQCRTSKKPSSSTEKVSDIEGGPCYMELVRTRIVEQRLSHFVMGLLIVGTMTRPLLHVLGLMPRAMFAGIFIIVGWGSIEGNGIVHKTLYLLRDPAWTPADHHLNQVRKSKIALYAGIQWVVFAMMVAIS